MSNKIQEARAQVAELTQAAYQRAVEAGKLPAGAEVKATIEIPKDTSHGDYASSYAMAGARALHQAPRPALMFGQHFMGAVCHSSTKEQLRI